MNFIGHKKIREHLDRSVEKDKISHAYLFCGPAHLGKFTLALDFAEKITNGESEKINPDIKIVRPEIEEKKGKIKKKSIKVEKVREIEHELSLSATGGNYRVVIIDEAEQLTTSSQNALLKTLEEPPEKTVMILIAENANKIISTIKSRCVIKKFGLVDDSVMDNLLSGKENSQEIKFWSLNRPGLAINFGKEKEELEKRKKAQSNLAKMISANLSEKFSICEELSKNVPEMVEEFNFWIAILRQNILGNDKFFQLNPQKALNIICKIEKSLQVIRETNSNPRLVAENLALEFTP
jgi:DNA polymerase-3 subunit delta'